MESALAVPHGVHPLMLIGPDSPIRNLPTRLNERQVLFLDGIRYSIEMVEIAYSRLYETLFALSVEPEPPPHLHPLAFQDAWSMVDSGNRLRILVQHMPQLKRSPYVKVLLRTLESAEDLRNAVQHLDQEIGRLAETNEPAWGWLTWILVAPDQTEAAFSVCFLVAGSLKPGEWAGPPVRPAGEVAPPVDRIELVAYGRRVSLTGLSSAIAAFTPKLEQSVRDGIGHSGLAGEATRGSDLFARIDFRSRPPG